MKVYDSYEYYTTKKRKNKIKPIIIIAIIIICALALLSIYLYSAFSNGSDGILIDARNYYCVQTGKYNDMSAAKKSANELAVKGGAGYIISDGGYRVLAGLYLEDGKCDEVINNLNKNGIASSKYIIKVNKFFIADGADAENIKSGIDIFHNTVERLYYLFIQTDMGALTITELTKKIKVLSEQVDTCINVLSSTDYNRIKTTNLKSELIVLCAALNNFIADDSLSTGASSKIKYLLIETAIIYKNFSELKYF